MAVRPAAWMVVAGVVHGGCTTEHHLELQLLLDPGDPECACGYPAISFAPGVRFGLHAIANDAVVASRCDLLLPNPSATAAVLPMLLDSVALTDLPSEQEVSFDMLVSRPADSETACARLAPDSMLDPSLILFGNSEAVTLRGSPEPVLIVLRCRDACP